MIRAIGPHDEAAWRDLWGQYLVFYETVLPEEVYATTWARLNDPDEPIWGALAFEGERAVGLTNFIYQRTGWSIEPACYLQDLYVVAGMRGGGHGRALIEYVAADAKARGLKSIHWQTHETNFTAQGLYDKLARKTGFLPYRKVLE